MSLALKTNVDWQPTATLKTLQARAYLIEKIRHFFSERNVLEVETPLLAEGGTTDPHINSFTTYNTTHPHKKLYLQTSPEFAMKRLLAAGSGAIFQICKAFRQEESGNKHHPEFTLLEWYRPEFDHFQLMTEVDQLLQHLLQTNPAVQMSYESAFTRNLAINPHTCDTQTLIKKAKHHHLSFSTAFEKTAIQDDWLDFLLTHLIIPTFDTTKPTMLYHYPASQAALSKIVIERERKISERFEVFYQGTELANGYHELTDATEQEKRFSKDNQKRQRMGTQNIEPDKKLIAAMAHGLPNCAGVALGLDRLIMLALDKKNISNVISFAPNIL